MMDNVDVLFGSKIFLFKSTLCIFMPLTLLNIPLSTSDSLRGHSVHFSHVERYRFEVVSIYSKLHSKSCDYLYKQLDISFSFSKSE